MARKKAHEEHTNHEAWAIPYGDLITLLLAFFVVMYSMSSVNEGKYRVLSESLNEAFGGPPRSPKPIQIGEAAQHGTEQTQPITAMPRHGAPVGGPEKIAGAMPQKPSVMPQKSPTEAAELHAALERSNIQRMADEVTKSMGELIDRNLVVVHKTDQWLEVEIRTDILFPSGIAQINADARPVLSRLAAILKPFPNPLRIEGHTDDRPIRTAAFPSNWQLSAARAASVVSLFMEQGVVPTRMSVAGFGEYHPVTTNDTVEGRNRNRRVVLVVLGDSESARSGAAAAVTDSKTPSGTDLVPAATPGGGGSVAAGSAASTVESVEPR